MRFHANPAAASEIGIFKTSLFLAVPVKVNVLPSVVAAL